MNRSGPLTIGGVVLSLLVVPVSLTLAFTLAGPPTAGSTAMHVVGLVAMFPGFVMGATGLWVAARG